MKEYLVITYIDHTPSYKVVRTKELIKILDAHREEMLKENGNPSKIAVYEIGDILLDWS